jgi:hypothetical protein
MSVTEIVTNFIKPSNNFIISHTSKQLAILSYNPNKETTEKYETDFNTLRHEAFTKFKCGPESKGYCNIGRACNDEGVCGSMETHNKPNGKHTKYRSCNGPLDTNCVSKVYCDQNYDCTPLYRSALNDNDRTTLTYMKTA